METAAVLIILLLCCCIVLLIVLLIGGFGFFLLKTPEEDSAPTITLENVTVEAEAEEKSTTENYTYDELSKNIKLNIKWSNGSDFDDVTNVYFTRTHGDKTEKKETDANGRKSNTTGNKIQFVQQPGEDMRGEHTIKVTYKLKGQTQDKVMTSFKTNISEDQLTLAADSLSPVSVSYSPATVPFSTEVETQKTTATLNPNPSGFGALFFIPSGDNNAIKIKRVSDGKFLTHSATWDATGGVFYVQSSTGDKRRISTTTTDDGNLLTSVGPTLKKYSDMNPEERQKSLFTISFAAYAGPLTSLTVGSAVQCESGDPLGAPNHAVYRYVGNNTLRHYPNPTIASSWDSNWMSFGKVADCTGLTKGTALPHKTVSDATVGSAWQCEAGDPLDAPNVAVYRYMGNDTFRHYPNPTIASSWDSNWTSFGKVADCTGVINGDPLPMKT